MSINVCIVAGNLGRDPELRQSNSGSAVCTLSVATTHHGGEGREPETTWHRVVCFGKDAENVARYVHAKDYVCVKGRLREQKWTDKDGNKRSTFEVVAERVDFGRSKSDGPAESTQPARAKSTRQPAAPPTQPPHTDAFDDNDIPF